MANPKNKNGLGRGLGALIAEEDNPMRKTEGSVLLLPITALQANSSQPREKFDAQPLEELAASIREQGVLQPLLVRKTGEDNYQIIAGERRFRASQMAGLQEVPCLVKDFDDERTLAVALIENVQRQDLGVMEEAKTYRRLIDEYNYTQADLAQRIGKSRVYVANTLRLLSLSDNIVSHLAAGRLSAGHGRALLTIENPLLRERVCEKALKENWTVRQVENYGKDSKNKAANAVIKKPTTAKPKSKEEQLNALAVQALQARLQSHLGTKVSIGEGKIVINYYQEAELERLLELLGVNTQL